MAITSTTRITGLFGDPVSHSLSPLMHNRAFGACGLDWVYVAFHVLPAHLAAAVRALPALNLAGVNVTIPHKEAVIPYLDSLSHTAAMIGAVNTIRVEADGSLTGHNTDAPGFAAALDRQGVSLDGQRLLLLGAGGAARAVAFQAAIDGAEEICLCDQVGERAAALASDLAGHFASCRVHCIPLERAALEPAAAAATVLVNATPVGMAGHGDYPIDLAWLHPGLFVYDLVYNPASTPLIAAARARAIRCDNGLTMLALQGATSFALWTGAAPPGESMIATLEELMRNR
ncbi:MAG: shikimate dehydrogenase [Nitrospirae bacterium CG18_big_fil_WC_8_21_14_2_50_70_55]|nr:shikimate dehydrogenase [Deltaproteobacteria bacterium]OIP66134.1 MAG: shikimate dehydrogenase [Nitrospirae bacterium CG2_30_70_394]PIQ03244.1 MAG: shikimate dehydrogenase [Nitrospirae bacterium CG18_big_fil_WC_8_21_14_2_50_70_55]PIU77483.1 MAG: shikimate dehydrogenase [Nitrospirae bacterium CG06_land_8_20_14_3_00_70_43]PIW83073.1 MAG: shikimate dehydrogenase [Nitrospirae bacterium CG_4_8_14_3_um_filter_70_85]PIX83266.1 MAG: shikimate dehydrogenase [Nitrospirae bacterium CG_4_10_14_3_um_fil